MMPYPIQNSMEERQDVLNAYDEISSVYHEETADHPEDPAQARITDRFRDELPPESLVLDAGCGGSPVQVDNAEVIGVDFSKNQLLENDGNDDLVQGDMLSLPFENATFDGITAFFSVIHVPLDDRGILFGEFNRVLKEGGVVLFTEGSSEWCGSNESWLGTGTEMKWEIAGPEKTKRHLSESGFTTLDTVRVRDTLGEEEGEKVFFLARSR